MARKAKSAKAAAGKAGATKTAEEVSSAGAGETPTAASSQTGAAQDAHHEADHEPERAIVDRPADLGLDRFASAPDDMGLSLEELSEAYASLLSDGADPYAGPADAEAGLDDEFGGEFGDDLSGALAGEPAAEIGDDDAESDDELDESSSSPGAESGSSRTATEKVGEDVRLPPSAEVEISPRTILEAMLFVGNPTHEPLTAKHVASFMRGVRAREIDELVVELNEAYAAENCAYQIESVGAGYRLVLRPELSGLRDRFYGRVKDAKLSQQAIDVLALVAYNQPLTRPEIDKLRNAGSGGVLSQPVSYTHLTLPTKA